MHRGFLRREAYYHATSSSGSVASSPKVPKCVSVAVTVLNEERVGREEKVPLTPASQREIVGFGFYRRCSFD